VAHRVLDEVGEKLGQQVAVARDIEPASIALTRRLPPSSIEAP